MVVILLSCKKDDYFAVPVFVTRVAPSLPLVQLQHHEQPYMYLKDERKIAM